MKNVTERGKQAKARYKWWLKHFAKVDVAFKVSTQQKKGWNFVKKALSNTMRTNLPKRLDLLIFCIYSLNFSLEFFIMIFFVTNQLNISKFLPPQVRKTLISY